MGPRKHLSNFGNELKDGFFPITKAAGKLLLLLLAVDFAFILLHLFLKLGYVKGQYLSIEADGGAPEIFQYIKEFCTCALFVLLAFKHHRFMHFSWALLFLYLLMDDSLQIHECLGLWISEYFEFRPRFNLRARDFGELLVTGTASVILFGSIALASLKSGYTERLRSVLTFSLLVLLVLFGVLVDMLHVAIPYKEWTWGYIEDSGEMLVMSLILSYVFSLYARQKESAPARD